MGEKVIKLWDYRHLIYKEAPNDFNYKAGDNSETKINAIIEVMGKVSPKRLYAGGFIGPVAAFRYCVGC